MNEIKLYWKDEITIFDKFYLLMNIIIRNYSNNFFEFYLISIINAFQIVLIYTKKQIGVFDKNDISDKILIDISNIVRYTELIKHNINYLKISIILISIFIFLFSLYFLYNLYLINNNSKMNNKIKVLIFFIKFIFNILTIIQFDLTTIQMCFGYEYNVNIPEIKCNQVNNKFNFTLSSITTIYLFIFEYFLYFFINDSFLINPTPFSKMICYYDHILLIYNLITSLSIHLIKEIHIGIFFVSQITFNIIFFLYFYKRLIYYETNSYKFHNFILILNIWISIFSVFVRNFKINQKGLIFFLTSILIYIISLISYNNLLNFLFKDIPYHQITNLFYVLFYVNEIHKKIFLVNRKQEEKNYLMAIIQLHYVECSNSDCITKTNEKLFLPKTNEWSNRTKPFILDEPFLNYFVISVMNYFINKNFYNVELIINLSLYYLEEIGNIHMSLYYFQLLKKMKLSVQESFNIKRLELSIYFEIKKKFKLQNKSCSKLEELNPTYLYKYEDLSEKFLIQIFNDLDETIKFWKFLSFKENVNAIDFNLIYKQIKKILSCKMSVNKLWNKLFEIYSGINEYFDLYLDYVGVINDNVFLQRKLENIKIKKKNYLESFTSDYYNLLFRSDIGIIICNGDKDKEGIIEKCNEEFGNMVGLEAENLKGLNISTFMPKNIRVNHNKFMNNYFKTGEDKIINNKNYKSIACNVDNYLLYLDKIIKLFPVINNNILYIGLIIKEKVDDMIFVDNNFIIQCGSEKLLKNLNFRNENIFEDYEIPFYVICKKFINFYKIFLKRNKQSYTMKTIVYKSIGSNVSDEESDSLEDSELEAIKKKTEEEIENKEIEINENIELEYEIQIPKFLEYFTKIISDNYNEKKNKNMALINFEKSINYSINNSGEMPCYFKDHMKQDKDDEKEKLISKNNSKKKIKFNNEVIKILPNVKETVIDTLKTSIISSKEKKKNLFLNFNVDNYQKLEYCKLLWKKEMYDELIDLLNKENNYKNISQINFNFTFEKYQFSNQYGFIIRCVSNSNDILSSDYDNQNLQLKNEKNNYYKIGKNKIKLFNNNFGIYEEEKKLFEKNVFNFYEHLKNNNILNILIENDVKEIASLSRIFGEKNIILFEDENSSQTGSSAFKDDLSKLNKIIENRNNLLNNSNDFILIKYIKIFPILIVIVTIVISIIYLKNIRNVNNKLIHFCQFINIYNNILINISIISNNILDLYLIYTWKSNNLSYYLRNRYNDISIYFEKLKTESIELCINSFKYISKFELDLANFIKDNPFWKKINIEYYLETPFFISEYITFYTYECVYNSYNIFQLDFFSIDNQILNVSNDKIQELEYNKYNSIQGTLNIIINYSLNYMYLFNNNIKTYIYKFENSLNIPIIIYLILIALLSIIYEFFIMKIKNYIRNSLNKIIKIPQNKIDELIINIKNFKYFYLKKIYKKKKIHLSIFEELNRINSEKNYLDKNIDIDKTMIYLLNSKKKKLYDKDNNNAINNSLNYSNYSINKKYIEFQFLGFTIVKLIFFLIIFLLLCLISFFLSKNEIKTVSQLLINCDFFFNYYYYTNIYILLLKSSISKNNNNINIHSFNFNTQNFSTEIFKDFPLLYDYYYNKFETDCCAAIYDYNTEEYKNCLNEDIVKKVNNSYSFFLLINKNIEDLLYELDTYNQIDSNFDSLTLFNTTIFMEIENYFKVYIFPTIDKLMNIIEHSLKDYIEDIYTKLTLIFVFLIIFILSNYILNRFLIINKLIHHLFVCKKIFIIIPSDMIMATPDLESWMEKMNLYGKIKTL